MDKDRQKWTETRSKKVMEKSRKWSEDCSMRSGTTGTKQQPEPPIRDAKTVLVILPQATSLRHPASNSLSSRSTTTTSSNILPDCPDLSCRCNLSHSLIPSHRLSSYLASQPPSSLSILSSANLQHPCPCPSSESESYVWRRASHLSDLEVSQGKETGGTKIPFT